MKTKNAAQSSRQNGRTAKPSAAGKQRTAKLPTATIEISHRQFALLKRMAEALETTPDTVAGYYLSNLDENHFRSGLGLEIGDIIGAFEYEPGVEGRVRRRVAGMIREEQYFRSPEHNEAYAKEVETGKEVRFVIAA
jgi:hypothetical protein